MSRTIPRREFPQHWSPKRRVRQSAIAKRKWAEKPKELRSRRARLASEIDDESYASAMADITVEFFFRRIGVVANMPKPAFVELAEAGGVDPDLVEAVRARLLRDFQGEEDNDR